VTSTQIPNHVPGHLVVSVDPVRDEEFRTDAFAAFERLAAYGPLLWTTADGGYWIPTRRADIVAVLKKFGVFASKAANTAHSGQYPAGLRGVPMRIDPPEQTKYRLLVAPLMSRRAAAVRQEEIRRDVVHAVSAVAPQGHCDVVADLARPIGTGVAARVIGMPTSLAEAFHHWKSSLWRREAATVSNREFIQDFLEVISHVRSDPCASEADTLISHLVRSGLDEHQFTNAEILDMALVFMLGGGDTIINSIGFAFQFLAHHPEVRTRIVAEPERIPELAGEILRMHSVVNTTRVAVCDTEIGGTFIRAGDRVLASTTLVGRDPVTYLNPTTVSATRRPAPHLAFGIGPHRCPGEHFARLQLHIILEEFHRRIPHYDLSADAAFRMTGAPLISITNVPLTWTT
jgi:cytochrome P450